MKKILSTLFILSGLVIFSCSSVVKSKKFTDKNMDDYKTYAYLPDTDISSSEFNRADGAPANESAVATLKKRLNERGYTMTSNNPDLVVIISESIGIGSNQKLEGRSNTAAASSSSNVPYSGSSTSSSSTRSSSNAANSTRPYQTGNMAIEVFDNKTKELVWIGLVKDYKTDIATTNLPESMVNAIFDKLPND